MIPTSSSLQSTNKRKELPTSSLAVPEPEQTNNLMSRLKTFLPQLQAANEALQPGDEAASGIDVVKRRRVDYELEQENDSSSSSSSDDDDDDDDDDESSDKAKSDKQQMIQIQFALTEQNDPVMNLLLDKDQQDDDDDDSNDNDKKIPAIETDKERVVANLLSGTTEKKKKKDETRQSKKPLITEIS